jgi:hypothetical protein
MSPEPVLCASEAAASQTLAVVAERSMGTKIVFMTE